MNLILASNSPRRRDILSSLGFAFSVEPSLFEERRKGGLSPHDTALAFALGKARDVALRHPDCLVLGADTVVALGETVLGKPKDEADARRMLRLLSGREHTVYTGVALVGPSYERSTVVGTAVRFLPLSDETVEGYVASGLPMDKAGAYGIQDGWPLVGSICGSYTNVVGLPAEEVGTMIKEALGGTS